MLAADGKKKDTPRIEFEDQLITFCGASDGGLEEKCKRVSYVRINLRPSTDAKIFILLSFAETANKEPSLLKRIRGLALKPYK